MSSRLFKLDFKLLAMVLIFIATGVTTANSEETLQSTGEAAQIIYIHEGTQLAAQRPKGVGVREPIITPRPLSIRELDEWVLLESLTNSLSIAPGDYYSIRFDLGNAELTEHVTEYEFSELTWEALNRVPRWMRQDLIDNMVLFGDWVFLQDIFAQILLDIDDPIVDEVAFSMAHLSPLTLTSGYMGLDFQLLVENAEDVYEADEALDYVQINDYGVAGDDDYWSTAEYLIKTAIGDTIELEIDRDIYYWFVMHPRLSDEIPNYIDPTTGNYWTPPQGVFWRDFLLNHPEEGYTSLLEMLGDCGVMYGNLFNNGTPANGAVGIVTQWVRHCMTFGAGHERPIQPVRIYHLHCGNCGEFQDITAAAARAALIPTLNTSSYTEDHVWNEFWDGYRWVTWEPVNNYVGDSLAYQGWGKRFPALFDWRGDGWIWTVTHRYHSNTTTLEVQILDAEDNPVDGAKVKMLSDRLYGGLGIATCGFTDSDGRVSFSIGGSRDIYLNISSPLGTDPENPNAGILVIEDSDPDVEYEWVYHYEEAMEINHPAPAVDPPDPLNQYSLRLEYTVEPEVTYGIVFTLMDFLAEVGTGQFESFICDEENYQLFQADEPFDAFQMDVLTGSDIRDFVFPDDQVWYLVLNNKNNLVNYQRMQLSASLREWTENALTIPLQGRYFELVSTFLVPEDLNAGSVFGAIPELEIVYQSNGGIYIPPGIINTIGDISLTQGYQIFCNSNSELQIYGAPLDPATEYTLVRGPWNWLGYPYNFRMPVEQALAPIEDAVEIVITDDGRMWIPPLINTLGEMIPGEGYMVIVNETVTFQYADRQ